MIERASETGNFMCVAYDRFEIPKGFALADATWEYHVTQVCRLITVGILAALESDEDLVGDIDDQHKRILKYCAGRFLSTLSADEFQSAVQSVKSLGDKARDIWAKWGGPIAGLVDAVLERLKLRAVHLDEAFKSQMDSDESLRFLLQRLSQIVRVLGFNSVYVLVDRVDEFDLTATDASKAFVFISPLLIDLPTLEEDGVGFKFFLCDATQDAFQSAGVRADRVSVHSLRWSVGDLKLMISQRLKAFSDGHISSLNELMCPPRDLDVDTLSAHLAAGSPRDLIRLMARVIAEETRVSDNKTCVTDDAWWAGVTSFSETRVNELFPGQLGELRRVGASSRITFTVNRLANDIYRVTTQAARARVQGWTNTGLVAQIGEVPNPPNRPMYLYGPIDLRLALAMLPNMSPDEVLANYALVCPECDSVAITDANEISCMQCSHRFALGDAQSLLGSCTER